MALIIPVSSFSPKRMAKTFASVPAFFFSPVLIFKVYVVDMAANRFNKSAPAPLLSPC